jgi:hypothetical protein
LSTKIREQVSNLAAGHRGQALQNVGEVFLRIDPVAAAALDDGVNDGATPTGIRMPDKEPAALSDGRGPYIVFDQVGIDFKPAIAQIAGPLNGLPVPPNHEETGCEMSGLDRS